MSKNAAQEIQEWSDVEYTRNRFMNDLGMDMPKTVAAKELVDNGLDQVNDGRASNVRIFVDAQHEVVSVMDDGKGISLRKNQKGQTHLYLAMGKLHTSSNYGSQGNQTKASTVGQNGVGASINNFLSKRFIAGTVKEGVLTGYVFEDGIHAAGGEKFDKIGESEEPFPMYEGFYVKAEYDGSIPEFGDTIRISWLQSYISDRVGELPEGAVVEATFIDTEGAEHYGKWTKIPEDPYYVPSWHEKVEAIPGSTVVKTKSGWEYAFGDEETRDAFGEISSMVQNAPVRNTHLFTAKFEVEEYLVKVPIPYSMYYQGKTVPRYTSQTKDVVKTDSNAVMKALQTNKHLYNHYYREAERIYLAEKLKKTSNHMSSFWPTTGSENCEIFITEGFSAASGVKATRNAENQAVLALRGKILNCRGKKLKDALKSDVINQLFTVLTNYPFERVIITTDADEDGMGHIAMLLIGLINEYMPDLIHSGKVYICDTPIFVFNKGNQMMGGTDPNECPEGWHIHPKKGLGALTQKETKFFITNPNTRTLIQLEYGDHAEAHNALDTALVSCGAEWVAS